MMKRIFPALCAALLLAGCGAQTAVESTSTAPAATAETPAESTATPEATDGTTLTFTDDLDREVTVPVQPQRVAVLLGSYADVWCLAGGQDTLVAAADDAWTDFDLNLGDEVANLGSLMEPNLEELIAAQPDLVIASSNTTSNVELLPSLEDLGVPVIYFGVNSFNDYLEMLDVCTQITGQTQNYQTYGLDVQAQVEKAKEQDDGSAPTVLLLRSASTSCKVKNSKGTVLGEILADLGAVNIADSDTSLLEDLSMERIIADDPDYIFVVFQGSDQDAAQKTLDAALTSNPAWDTLSAVQNGNFYLMEKELYHLKPNARWGEAYQKVADILYPAA
ncbi:MAG TPA: ABC transporter substrate-binding protein [Candidatus Gemmiger excrementigallinarum]|uniref:ABC transporter substrate-binding protein n=1 Tax=Candidatus Gemmiger excrementigallinarum TaxID=2838609 RepID=A0A9D2ESB1_9FIRM|nr:ABC transporter substrate-binding protein [Candidatus Gemmiger excrementigallinarum]